MLEEHSWLVFGLEMESAQLSDSGGLQFESTLFIKHLLQSGFAREGRAKKSSTSQEKPQYSY